MTISRPNLTVGPLCRGLLSATLLLATLAGCGGELAFKRGASSDNMQAAEARCHRQDAQDDRYTQCMKDAGWYTTKLDSAAAPQAAALSQERSAGPVPAPLSQERSAAPVPALQPSGAVMDQRMKPATVTAMPAAAQDDPSYHQIVNVGSWWKLGGTEGDLVSALTACAGPAPDRTRISRAAISCMRLKGWYAVGTK